MSVPTFVVGTGRCGSTMLSNMLREHPHVLSLSEFYAVATDGGRTDAPFSQEPIDGRQFWSIVAGITPFISFCLRHHVTSTEWLYPSAAPAARFSWQSGVPAILLTSLPHLTDDYDALFSMLQDDVIGWPKTMIGEHYRHLFGLLTRHFNKRIWVERSGGGLEITDHLLATFPDAKFVHIVRDGRDAAISMQAHLVFRVGVVLRLIQQHLGVNPVESLDRVHIARVPKELHSFLPEQFDADALRAFRLPLPLWGQYWSQQMDNGLRLQRAVPDKRFLALRYEDFLADPKRQLDIFTDFLGNEFVDEDWAMGCARMVRPPWSTWRDLPEEEARVLTEACRPGFELLEAAGVHYNV